MPSISELRSNQKRKLYEFLMIQRDLGETSSKALTEFIVAAKAEMEVEDVAYVEKLVESLPK